MGIFHITLLLLIDYGIFTPQERDIYDTLYNIGAVYLSETLMREDLARKGPDVPDVVRPDIPMRASTAVACLTRLDVQSGSGRAGPVVPRKNNVNFAKISDCITLLRMKHFAIP